MSSALFSLKNNDNVGRIKRKSAFEHAQNVRIHIIRCMHKVSSGSLFSIDTFYSIQWFWQRTAKALIRLRSRAVWSGPSLFTHAPKAHFNWRGSGYLRILQGTLSVKPIHDSIIAVYIAITVDFLHFLNVCSSRSIFFHSLEFLAFLSSFLTLASLNTLLSKAIGRNYTNILYIVSYFTQLIIQIHLIFWYN